MNKDQHYMYRICQAAQNGMVDFPAKLLTAEPESLHQARWIIQADRTPRLYAFTEKAPFYLGLVVFFILHQCVFSWFRYRLHPWISDGAKKHPLLSAAVTRAERFLAPQMKCCGGNVRR